MFSCMLVHRRSLGVVIVALSVVALAPARPAAAQDERSLRTYFEGRRVTLKIDMPGTSDGVDIRVDASSPLDYERYGTRLKTSGTAIRAGDSVTVTLVKVKKDLIEFQLGGGGFGTFGDDATDRPRCRSSEGLAQKRSS